MGLGKRTSFTLSVIEEEKASWTLLKAQRNKN